MTKNEAGRPELKRALNLPMLTLYGLGTTIGAGIYALLGEIAGTAGYGAPFSFLIASLLAAFTACSFAELAARFPRAAGAALYVQKGLGTERLSTVVGLLVVASGLVSSAALVNGFQGYLQEFVELDRTIAIPAICAALAAIAAYGIVQSVTVAAAITVVEIGGLILVIAVGADNFAALPERWPLMLPGTATTSWVGVLMGVSLAFYAFIGFEDMVDLAEEVKNVRRNMPRGILLTLGITTVLYFVLMISALLALTPEELAASSAPMARLFEAGTGNTSMLISVIALFAIINGALIQLVMVSRVLYGLGSRRKLPQWFARVNPKTRTPLVATLTAAGVLFVLALSGHLAALAKTTSLLMLTIFMLVNLALWRIKSTEAQAPDDLPTFPRIVPAMGALLSGLFVLRELSTRLF
jgi:amino acid transporter